MNPAPLTVYGCTHCRAVRREPCSVVCRLDTDHDDTLTATWTPDVPTDA